MRRLAASFALLAALTLPSAARAQNSVLSTTPWTPGHAAMYVGQGSTQPVITDSGPASGGGTGLGLGELLLVARGNGTTATPPFAGQGTGPYGANICDYDGPTTAAAGYHFFCISANAQGGGLIAYGNGGAASALPLAFIVNGTTYQFPFATGGIVGPGTTVVNDVACWNNLVGTLLKDCGPAISTSTNNTWTGTNNFTSTFQISGTTQTFPASGALVGLSDTQSLTNKSINASEVNSGTLACTQMPALTGNVTSSAGACTTTVANNAVTVGMLAQAAANTVLANPTGSTANVQAMAMPSCSAAGSALQWTSGSGIGCATLTSQTAGWGLTGSSVFSISTSAPPYSFDAPINLGLTSSVGSSALTITLVAADTGATPTASHPVLVPFRSATLTTGVPVWTALTGATTITVNSGATLGTASSNVPFRVWIFLGYNAGSPQLEVATCSTTTQIYPCSAWEAIKVTSTPITGLATAAGTLYAPAGVSNDLHRIIGYCDYSAGLGTAGAWVSACTTIQVFGPGIKKPGDVVQSVYATSSSGTTGSGTTFTATTPAVSITPTSTPNLILADAKGSGTAPAGTGFVIGQVFRASGASAACTTAVGVFSEAQPGSSNFAVVLGGGLDAPATASQQTYAVCVKAVTSGNAIYCGVGASGGVTPTCTIRVDEIQGALDSRWRVPANDNHLLRAVG